MGRYHSEGTLFRVRPSEGIPYVPLTLIVSLFTYEQSSVKADVMLIDVTLVHYLEYDDKEDIYTITCTVPEVCRVLQVFLDDIRFQSPDMGIEITKHDS